MHGATMKIVYSCYCLHFFEIKEEVKNFLLFVICWYTILKYCEYAQLKSFVPVVYRQF